MGVVPVKGSGVESVMVFKAESIIADSVDKESVNELEIGASTSVEMPERPPASALETLIFVPPPISCSASYSTNSILDESMKPRSLTFPKSPIPILKAPPNRPSPIVVFGVLPIFSLVNSNSEWYGPRSRDFLPAAVSCHNLNVHSPPGKEKLNTKFLVNPGPILEIGSRG